MTLVIDNPAIDFYVEQVGSYELFAVFDRGARVGTVLGGGSTAATRFKSIAAEDSALDPDSAPGGCWTTLEAAAESLRGGWSPDARGTFTRTADGEIVAC